MKHITECSNFFLGKDRNFKVTGLSDKAISSLKLNLNSWTEMVEYLKDNALLAKFFVWRTISSLLCENFFSQVRRKCSSPTFSEFISLFPHMVEESMKASEGRGRLNYEISPKRTARQPQLYKTLTTADLEKASGVKIAPTKGRLSTLTKERKKYRHIPKKAHVSKIEKQKKKETLKKANENARTIGNDIKVKEQVFRQTIAKKPWNGDATVKLK